MRVPADQVIHFSEDPRIERFAPHVAATARQPEPYVWAVDAKQAPAYWFPRQCPRAMAWVSDRTTAHDRTTILATDATRVHAIEYPWLQAMSSTALYGYRFKKSDFRPLEDHAYVASTEVFPLGPAELVGDLFDLHDRAGIELRVVRDLRPWWERVVRSSLEFSGIRLRNSRTLR